MNDAQKLYEHLVKLDSILDELANTDQTETIKDVLALVESVGLGEYETLDDVELQRVLIGFMLGWQYRGMAE